MNSLFEPLSFAGKPYLWSYMKFTDRNFKGYYHWHQGCECLIVHRGQGMVIVNRQTYELRPGMLFFFQPYQLHKVHVEVDDDHPYERSVFHFEPEAMEKHVSPFSVLSGVLNKLRSGLKQEQAFDMSNEMTYIYEMCKALNRYEIQHAPHPAEEHAALFLLQLMGCIRSVLRESGGPASVSRLPRYSDKIMQQLEESYKSPFDLQALADQLHLSRTYVSRVFRQETGSSIMDYLTARRIKEACSLLHSTDMPVHQIAEEVGLSNASYFIRLFKQVVGITPYQYKRAID